MGLFQQRPEEPTEWAGLPSEPWVPRTVGDVLAPPIAELDPFAAGTSISVPVSLPAVIAEPSGVGDGADAADADGD